MFVNPKAYKSKYGKTDSTNAHGRIQNNPDRIAIEKAPDTYISYKELYNRAGKIASYLKKQELLKLL